MMGYGANRIRRMAGLDTTMPMVQTPGYWWNDQRIPKDRPYNERFAGGQLQAKFVPFSGDPLQYGAGPQHRFNQVDPIAFTTSTASSPATTTSTATDTSYTGQGAGQGGGPDGGDVAANQAMRDSLPEYDNFGDWISAMAGTPSLGLTGLAQMAMGRGFAAQDRSYATVGENKDVAAQLAALDRSIAEARGSNEAVAERNAASAAAAAAEQDPNAYDAGVEAANPGNTDPSQGTDFAEGGIIEGDDVPGEDDVTIRADGGEGVLKNAAMSVIGEDVFKALNAAVDLESLEAAYSLLGERIEEMKEEPEMEERDEMEEAIVAKNKLGPLPKEPPALKA